MSDIKFQCPHCVQSYEASADLIGTSVTCQTCGKDFTIKAPAVFAVLESCKIDVVPTSEPRPSVISRALKAKPSKAQKLAMNELKLLAKLLLMDNALDNLDVQMLRIWLHRYRQREFSAINELAVVFDHVTRDGFPDPRGLGALKDCLSLAVKLNEKPHRPAPDKEAVATQNFFDTCPSFCFRDKRVCFTGELAWGSRSKAFAEVIACGGIVLDVVSPDLDYLIVGDNGSDQWRYGNRGLKIVEAIAMRKHSGHPLIVCESNFLKALEVSKG